MSETVLTHANIMGFVASAKPEEARKFYAETLGLKFLQDQEYSLIFSVNLDSDTARSKSARSNSPAIHGIRVAGGRSGGHSRQPFRTGS